MNTDPEKPDGAPAEVMTEEQCAELRAWITSIDPIDIAHMVIALSQRQQCGSTYPKIANPYDMARKYSRDVPSHFLRHHFFPY